MSSMLLVLGIATAGGYTWAALDRWPTDTTHLPSLALRAIVAGVLIAVPAVRPSWGVYLIFAAVPFFGNRPGGRYMEFFNIAVAANVVGLTASALLRRAPLPTGPVWLATAAYLASVAAALVPALPGIARRSHEVNDLSLAVIQAFTSREDDPLYSANSVLLVSLAVAWATALARVRDERLARNALRAAVAGFFVVMILGILDFHGVVDLEKRYLQVLDPTSLSKMGFQSIFWNPGWFAWYFAATFGVAVGLLFVETAWRRLALATGLAVSYVYFLANPQRGGVLALHAALGVALALGLWRKRRDPGTLRRTAAVATAVLVGAIVLFVVVPAGSHWFEGVRRLAAMPPDHVRRNLALTAMEMWRDAPVFGTGEAAFAWRYRQYVAPGSPRDVHAYGDAHNTWLQILATRGLVGLLAFVALAAVVGVAAVRAVGAARPSITIGICASLAAFFAYSFLQHLFYLQATQVFFWGLIALLPWVYPSPPRAASSLAARLLVAATIVAVALAVWTERHAFARMAHDLAVQPKGFHAVEDLGHGRLARWSSREGTLCLYPTGPATVLQFAAFHPDVARRPLRVTVHHGGALLDRFAIDGHAVVERVLALPPSARRRQDDLRFGECQPGADAIHLTIKVDRVWSPRSLRLSDDGRHLGVAVLPVDGGW